NGAAQQVLAQYDKDKNSKLSRAEIGLDKALFDRLDANLDGICLASPTLSGLVYRTVNPIVFSPLLFRRFRGRPHSIAEPDAPKIHTSLVLGFAPEVVLAVERVHHRIVPGPEETEVQLLPILGLDPDCPKLTIREDRRIGNILAGPKPSKD